MLATLRRWFDGLRQSFRSLFAFRAPTPAEGVAPPGRTKRTWRVVWRSLVILFLLVFIVWNGDFLWNVLWTRGYSLAYPKTALAGATPQTADPNDCRPSAIVDVQEYLINFVVNENAWI